MISAKIENGIVTNTIVGTLPGYITCPDGVGIGWQYNGTSFSEPVPLVITSRIVNEERNKRMQTFTYNGVVYDFDEDSRQNIAGASILALAAMGGGAQIGDYRWANSVKDFSWITNDNNEILMDAQTCFDFSQKAAAWKSFLIFAARGLKDYPGGTPADFATNETYWTMT